ncbi:HD domain-containing protein [Nocardia sp. IFM 10818]
MEFSRRNALAGAGLAGVAMALQPGRASAEEDALALPTTPLAAKAQQLMEDSLTAAIRNHSVRGYLFGRRLAQEQGLRAGADFDDELVYLICALHDIGLSDVANGDQRFEVDGADFAARFLEENGVTGERVDVVWDAIAVHTLGFIDSPVFRRRRRPEIWIAVSGIGIDVGGGPGDLPAGYGDLVHARYPRLGGGRALADIVDAQAMANPLKAMPGTLANALVQQRHPEKMLAGIGAVDLTNNWGD